MIEFLKRHFTDEHYAGSLRLGPFYLIKGKRIPYSERFSPDSVAGQRARGITAADTAEAGELEGLNRQIGADTNFANNIELRRQGREAFHTAKRAQANRMARFKRKKTDLTAILGDEEAAIKAVLEQQGFIIAATPEPKKSSTAEIIAGLRGAAVLGTNQGRSDNETLPDLPEFLKELT